MTRTYTECVAENTRRAERIISALDLQGLWCSIGAEIHQVGSMRMGLLAKHRDLDSTSIPTQSTSGQILR